LRVFFFIKDQSFFPNLLAGKGDCDHLFSDSPQKEVKELNLYYMIQCGWHFYKFVDAIIAGLKTNKFYEYGLLHGLALFLICFSYLYNYLVIGTVVLFLHDVGDLGVLIAELFAEYGKGLYKISGIV
jgi:ceramide synthetase